MNSKTPTRALKKFFSLGYRYEILQILLRNFSIQETSAKDFSQILPPFSRSSSNEEF